MNHDNKIQQKNYFNYRNINDTFYKDFSLPFWIKSQLVDKDITILDYGCGFGQILKSLKKNGYEKVYGVDIEQNAISCCLDNNLNVKELSLDKLKNPFNFKFDIIILSHVIEHIPKNEIINMLILIKNEFLESNGKVLLAVPNAQSNTDSYWAYEDWTHTTLFTSGSIYYVLKAAGFDNIEFLDIDCIQGGSKIKQLLRKGLLKLYIMNKNFWNKVTCSSYHKPSTQIFSYEIKVKAY